MASGVAADARQGEKKPGARPGFAFMEHSAERYRFSFGR
jgi:hypothetical protein